MLVGSVLKRSHVRGPSCKLQLLLCSWIPRYTVWKLRKFTLTVLSQKLRETNDFSTELHFKSCFKLFSRNFLSESEILVFPHCDVIIWHYLVTQMKAVSETKSWINGNYSNFFQSVKKVSYCQLWEASCNWAPRISFFGNIGSSIWLKFYFQRPSLLLNMRKMLWGKSFCI